MEEKHKALIKALQNTAIIFGICPWEKPSVYSVLYQIFTLCATFSCSLVSIYANCVKNYSYISPLFAFFDLLASTFAVIQGTSIQVVALVRAKTWRKLLEELNFENENCSKLSIYFELFVLNFLFTARIALGVYALAVVELNKYYIHVIFHEYYGMIVTALILHINCIIKSQIFSMYDLLKLKDFQNPSHIRQFESAYNKVMIMLNDFNYVFGYQIMFIMGYSVAVVLYCLCNVLRAINLNNVSEVLLLSQSIINAGLLVVYLST